MTDQTELLPCPFCGALPDFESVGMDSRTVWYRVFCSLGCCAGSAPHETCEQAATAWNNRSASAVAVKPLPPGKFCTECGMPTLEPPYCWECRDGQSALSPQPPHPVSNWEAFGRAIMAEWQAHCDVDALERFELALKHGVLVEIEGGFDPEKHVAEYCDATKGDPWYQLAPPQPPVTPEQAARVLHDDMGPVKDKAIDAMKGPTGLTRDELHHAFRLALRAISGGGHE